MELMEMRDIWRAIRRRLLWIAGFAVLASAAAGWYTQSYVSPIYQASASLIIHHAADDGASALDLGTVTLNLRLVGTYKQILQSEAVMERVAARYPELGVSAAELLSRVMVATNDDSQVMTVTVRDRSQEKAAAIANAVSFVFRDMIPEIMNANNVEILSEAKPSGSPIAPRPLVSGAVAFVLAIIAGIAYAFFMGHIDDTLRDSEDIETAIGAPPLAVISAARRRDFKAGVRERAPLAAKEASYATVQR